MLLPVRFFSIYKAADLGCLPYVYNNIGQIAAKSDITGTVTTMNQNLPSGVYIVKVMTGTHELTEKIIVK